VINAASIKGNAGITDLKGDKGVALVQFGIGDYGGGLGELQTEEDVMEDDKRALRWNQIWMFVSTKDVSK